MVNEEVLKKSFEKIKQDTDNLRKNDEYLQNDIDLLRSEIYDKTFIEKIADSIIEKIETRLKSQEKVEKIETRLKSQEKVEKIETPIIEPQEIPQNHIPNHVDSTMFLKRKIKAKIASLCQQRVRPGNLKRAIVEIAKLCSKATFYRYVSELKREGIIQTIEINNEAFLLTSQTVLDRNIYK